MRRSRVGVAVLLCATGVMLRAQAPAASQPSQAEAVQDSGAVLRVRSRLVVVDVVVRDARNQPVHGLPREAFEITEDRAAQRMRSFEAHTATDTMHEGPPAPKLPPGSFTNYSPVPQDGTLNVLLVDSLNTPTNDQTYLRDQLLQFVQKAPRGQSLAIFGLGSRLTLLQGFTQDPEALRAALQRRTGRNGSSLLDDPTGTRTDSTRASEAFADLGPGTEDAVASLQQFESDTAALQQGLRAQFTLDALTAMGRYLSAFTGRKNLIWFSGAFPINLLPDPNVTNGFRGMQLNAEQLKRTSDLLRQARVSVYPVDARGLQTPPMFDAANSGRRYAGAPAKVGADLTAFQAATAAEQTAMQQIAADTGGRAFINTNGLADAVGHAVREGEDYYTLSYSPTNAAEDGSLRHIHVTLAPAYATGLTLSYRPGYLALPPEQAAETTAKAATASVTPLERMALGFGAPPLQDILFQVRLEAGSHAADAHAKDARTYTVHLGALADGFAFAPTAGGRRAAQIGFQVLVYSPEGELEDRAGKQLRLNLNAAEYAAVQNAGVGLSLDVHATPGSFLRVVVEDVPTHHFGALQVSVSRAVESAAQSGRTDSGVSK